MSQVIGLLPFDSKIPNLGLMKLATYHKSKGDTVALFDKLTRKPDIIYVSVVFSWNRQAAYGLERLFPDIKFVYGGSACNYEALPDEVEHQKPDYDLYPTSFSMGFTSRGCLRKCGFCIVPAKEGYIRDHSPLSEFVDPSHKEVLLLDNNLLASPSWRKTLIDLRERGLKVDFNQGLDIRLLDEKKANLLADLKYYGYPSWNRKTLRFAFDNPKDRKILERGINLLTSAGIRADSLFFYILSGFNTVIAQDVQRVEFIHSLGAVPFIMKYNKQSTPELNKLAKWVNHIPFYQVISYDEFKPSMRKGVPAS